MGRNGEILETKYPSVVQVELNAVLINRGVSLEDSEICTLHRELKKQFALVINTLKQSMPRHPEKG